MNSFLYVGTNEGSVGGGIYCALFDHEKGWLNNFRMAARLEKAGFLAVHPSGNRIYSFG